MKLFYTEEILYNTFERLKNLYKEELINYETNTPIVAILKKANGSDVLSSCFIDMNSDGLLVILMHPFKVEEIKGYQYFKFYNMQGIKIKRGLLNMIIKIQFLDGTQYVFQIVKRKLRHLPHQKENLENIMTLLKSKNLNNMNNQIYKDKKKKDRVDDFIYITTLLLLELIVIIVINNVFHNLFRNSLILIMAILLIFVLHFILLMIIGILIDHLKNLKFTNAYTVIMKEYREIKDDSQFLKSLLNIESLPKTQDKKNIYYLSLSTAYYKTNNKIEAKNVLLKIVTNNQEILQAVKNQMKLLEE